MVKDAMLCLKLRSQGSKNGMEILLVGSFGLVFIMLVNLLRPGLISIVEIFLVSVCLVAVFVGFLNAIPQTASTARFHLG